ncbi:MAG: Transcription initiation factor IIB [Methanonatronarchaeales archaeon]|nr:Transcription initiation factor IIB [Methanonatronarchaeales archaeon]
MVESEELKSSVEVEEGEKRAEAETGTKRESQGEYEEELKCPECESPELRHDYKRAELVCDDCGLVVDDAFIDTGPEWRAFDNEQRQKRARTGAPMTMTQHDKGLTSVIGSDDTDSYGSPLSSSKQQQFYRLKKWQRRARLSDSNERNMALALGEINRMSSQLDIPQSIQETASVIYRSATKADLIRGRSIEGVSGAALYIACRHLNVPRTLDEIAEVARIPKKELGRTFRFIASELNINMMPASPIDYVPRFCSKLGASQEVRKEGEDILRKASEIGITSGRSPTSIAAAAIYIAGIQCGESITQREVADATCTTEVTVRNRYKELAEELDLDLRA